MEKMKAQGSRYDSHSFSLSLSLSLYFLCASVPLWLFLLFVIGYTSAPVCL
jgi:hypothetical protein